MDKTVSESTKVKLLFVNVSVSEELDLPNDYKISNLKENQIQEIIPKIFPDKTIYQTRLFCCGKELKDDDNLKNVPAENIVIHIHCNFHSEPEYPPDDPNRIDPTKRECCSECMLL